MPVVKYAVWLNEAEVARKLQRRRAHLSWALENSMRKQKGIQEVGNSLNKGTEVGNLFL